VFFFQTMSTSSDSPPSLHSDQELDDSRDSTSSNFQDSIVPKYTNPTDLPQKGESKINVSTSHGVEDILSVGGNYSADNVFQDKPEVLSSISHTFVQDYNSRDSTGFSIQDILGLGHQSYNPTNHPDDLESRYDYQIPNYENISNSSFNNNASGTEEIISDCIDKGDNNIFGASSMQVGNHIIYNRNFTSNETIRYNTRSGLDSDINKDPVKLNDAQESSFPSQVKYNAF
jgi:hypothetical protein